VVGLEHDAVLVGDLVYYANGGEGFRIARLTPS
jgi:hypothetical protein